jgi:arsenical pump membrane protein
VAIFAHINERALGCCLEIPLRFVLGGFSMAGNRPAEMGRGIGTVDGNAVAAVCIFLLTLTLVIWQPRGIGIGWPAAGGALLALAFGVVTLGDVQNVVAMVWNATLAFVAAVVISIILDEIGFFEWAALHMARFARGAGRRMFVYVALLGALVTALFNNDGGALILTPIVLALVRALKFPDAMVLPYVMASGFIADTTSLPLVVSNLVNIMSADYFGIGFAEYALRMVPVNFVSLAASVGMLYWFFRKQIPATCDSGALKSPREAIRDHRLFRLSWVILGMLLAAYFAAGPAGIPLSAAAGAAALLFLAAARGSEAVRVRKVVKDAPWSVIVFSIGMYVVVYGLRNAGLTDVLAGVIQAAADRGLFWGTMGMGMMAAFLSSVMNNLPTVMIDAIAIGSTATEGVIREGLIYANVIGSDLGPKMTPIGSLATLLWLQVLARKGVKITWGYYIKTGVVLTIPTLLLTLAGLYVWLIILD